MGHLWNEPQNDFGTDGSIELVDPAKEKATNRIVLVQSKATSVSFGERPIGFTCDEDDVRYWLHGNAPVILVRSHPASGEAYWVSVKDYFKAHPEQRATRRILFDRETDRFDRDCGSALCRLARPRIDGLPSRVRRRCTRHWSPTCYRSRRSPTRSTSRTHGSSAAQRHARCGARPLASGRGIGSSGPASSTASATQRQACSPSSAQARPPRSRRGTGRRRRTKIAGADSSGC